MKPRRSLHKSTEIALLLVCCSAMFDQRARAVLHSTWPSGESVQAAQSASSSAPSSPTEVRYSTNPDPNAQVTVLENTLIRVMTTTPVSTARAREGTTLAFTLSEDVVVDHVLIIPRGAMVHGTVVRSKRAGKLKGSAELVFELTSLDLGGRSYPLYTYQFKVEGASKSPVRNIVKGAFYGGLAGGVALGRTEELPTGAEKAEAMGAGAAAGAGVVTLASATTPAPPARLPAESEIDFYLAAPISVVPVTAKEAARLSQQMEPGGPVLYLRGGAP